MTKKIFMLLCLTLSLIGFSQILNDSTVQAITYWKKGEVMKYKVNINKLEIKDKDTIATEKTRYDAELTVLKQTPKSYTIQWQCRNMLFETNDNLAKKLLAGATKDIKVIYQTDENGGFEKIVNIAEMKTLVKKNLEAIQKEFPADTPTEVKKVFKNIFNTFLTNDGIEELSSRQIKQFHYFYGAKYQIGKPSKVEDSETLLGMDIPIRNDISVDLTKIDTDNKTYSLDSKAIINPDDAKKFLRAFVQKIMGNIKDSKTANEELDEELKKFKMEKEILVKSTIKNHGWLVNSHRSISAKYMDKHTIEKSSITLK
jgi:hypothetical protein